MQRTSPLICWHAGRMSGETDLATLLRSMRPVLDAGRYVYASVPTMPEDVSPVVTVREEEGLTLVLERDDADRAGVPYEYVAGRITLQVHSSLEAVGLTAAVARALTDHGISCNVVAGYFHDHLFVPLDRADEAVEALEALAR
jgi:hypothetical protein